MQQADIKRIMRCAAESDTQWLREETIRYVATDMLVANREQGGEEDRTLTNACMRLLDERIFRCMYTGSINDEKTVDFNIGDFIADKGWSVDDIKKIGQLEVGETLVINDTTQSVVVWRLQ